MKVHYYRKERTSFMAIIRETVDKVIRKILKENPEQIYKQSKERTQKEWIRTLGKYYFIG